VEIERIQVGALNSRAIIYNGILYMSGTVADDKLLPMKTQTEQILAKIDAVLAQAGTDKSRILSATVYLADISKKDEMNEAWKEWLAGDRPPARAAVEVTLTPNTLVEIMICAAI